MGAKLINIHHHPRKSWSQLSREVYIMKSLDFYKIGVSENVNERMKNIQAENPMLVELIYRSGEHYPAHKLAYGFEHEYHRILKKHNMHLHHEWFDLTKEMVENVIEWIKEDFAEIDNLIPENPDKLGRIYIQHRPTGDRENVLKTAA